MQSPTNYKVRRHGKGASSFFLNASTRFPDSNESHGLTAQLNASVVFDAIIHFATRSWLARLWHHIIVPQSLDQHFTMSLGLCELLLIYDP
jgi:hypothetical protein